MSKPSKKIATGDTVTYTRHGRRGLVRGRVKQLAKHGQGALVESYEPYAAEWVMVERLKKARA